MRVTTLRPYLYNVACVMFFACTYYVLAKQYGTEKDKRSFLRYEDALYYTTITHFTIGFGDIAPESTVLRRLTMAQVIISFYLLKSLLTRK
jgi:uncharacterized membrane protein